MAPTKDPYELLGVSQQASEDEIKKAFKQKARMYHPDNRETGDEEKFKEVGQAYDILSDPRKKAIYDQYGMDGFQQGGAGAGQDFSGFTDLSDLFSEFFGTGRSHRRTGPERGADIRYNLEIEFLEAINGCEKKINIPTLENCKTCEGTGAKPGTEMKTCGSCNGAGEVKKVTESFFGHVTQIVSCPSCEGVGKIIEDPCKDCTGQGRVKVQKDIDVKVPCGIDEGARLRWAGKGQAGRKGGEPGDLYVVIYVKEHEVFERDGMDILIRQTISFSKAALGGKVEVPITDGKSELKIPAGIQSGKILKMSGMGAPKLNNASRRGDQLVQIIVQTPEKLSKDEKKLYEELEKLEKSKKTKKGLF